MTARSDIHTRASKSMSMARRLIGCGNLSRLKEPLALTAMPVHYTAMQRKINTHSLRSSSRETVQSARFLMCRFVLLCAKVSEMLHIFAVIATLPPRTP